MLEFATIGPWSLDGCLTQGLEVTLDASPYDPAHDLLVGMTFSWESLTKAADLLSVACTICTLGGLTRRSML